MRVLTTLVLTTLIQTILVQTIPVLMIRIQTIVILLKKTENPEVIGSSFYVMDYVEGRIFWEATLPEVAPEGRGAIYQEMVRAYTTGWYTEIVDNIPAATGGG